MPIAVVTFAFDPIVRIGDLTVRWETIGMAASILLALLAAAILARRIPLDTLGRRPRPDDLLSIVIGSVPGAVLGGRIGYALIHLDYYSAHPAALLDAGGGGFELGLGVAGGIVTAAYVGRIIDAPIDRWAHVAALPLLLAIGGGKAAMAWGGSGQGSLTDVAWATDYAGPGPWGSLATDLPAHPAQLYEAGVVLAVAVVLLVAIASGAFARRDGRLLLVAVGLWLAARAAIATTWRDPAVLGPLSADQILSIVLAALALVGVLAVPRRRRGGVKASSAAWPDPAVAESWRGRAKS